MSKFGIIEDTLFIPLLGRIYASERYPHILYDKSVLNLKLQLPLTEQPHQSQYALLASACRAANMDRFVRNFLTRKPDGAIVQLGCGLETAYFRCDNGRTLWYALDLPHVIDFRKELLGEPEREHLIAGDAFSETWIHRIRTELPHTPLLVTAGGLFHYFEETQILRLFRMLAAYGNIDLVFDAVSSTGLLMMQKKYMKQVSHSNVQMFFAVDTAQELAIKTGYRLQVLTEEPFYCHIPRTGLKLSTRLNMKLSDRFSMVKMIHLQF